MSGTLTKEYLLQVQAGLILRQSLMGFATIQTSDENLLYQSYAGYKASLELKRVFKVSSRGKRNLFGAIEIAYKNSLTDTWGSFIDVNGESYIDYVTEHR
ncbi:MAG: hypothetical protein B7C24_05380 [Bacteroidetes bacterium 4572_77]|nr:MAG: hypothetical protein B7C24_05380 [Bacteroidetes bacterium 4572_77]